jgi:hypothetical protein
VVFRFQDGRFPYNEQHAGEDIVAGQSPTLNQRPSDPDETKKFLLNRYEDRIGYYWRSSRHNKRAYKTSRFLTIILGAIVTLVASISSAEFVKSSGLSVLFAVMTPVLAALLAIAGGLSQSFQWGAAWSEMVLTAELLEKERDRLTVTPAAEIDAAKELDVLNDLVVAESRNFFQRILGTQKPLNGNTAT